MSPSLRLLVAAFIVTAVFVADGSTLDHKNGGPNFNPRDTKGISASAQKMRAMWFGCPSLDAGDVNITCRHEKLEAKLGPGIDCAEKVPVNTKAFFLNCQPGYGIVEEYQIITCKFPGKWDNDVFTCDEKPTDPPTTTKPTTKTTNKTTMATTTKKPATTTIKTTVKPTNATTVKPANISTTAGATNASTASTASTATSASPASTATTASSATTVPATTTDTVATTTTTAATTTTTPATTTTTSTTTAAATTTTTVAPTTASTVATTSELSTTTATTTDTTTLTTLSTTAAVTSSATTVTTPAAIVIPNDYHNVTDIGIVKKSKEPATFENATADCAKDGAHIMVVDTSRVRFVLEFMSQSGTFTGATNTRDIWQGLVGLSGKWKTYNGTDSTKVPGFMWMAGRPVPGTTSVVWSNAYRAHFDLPPGSSHMSPYICEWQKPLSPI